MGLEMEAVETSVFPGDASSLDVTTRSLEDTETGHDTTSPYISAIIVATVGGALVFQAIFRKLETWVKGKRHAEEVLHSLFKGLAILGLIAFTLFAVESIDSIHLDEDLVDVFDMIHMSIFIITLLYATFTGMILYLSTRISAKWKYLEDIDTYNYDSLIKQCDAVNEQLGLGFDAQRKALMRHLAYQEIRLSFISENGLPNNFRFVIYLEKCKQQVVLQLAEIGESAWVTLALFVSCVMYFQAVFHTQNMNLFVVELFLALFPVVVAILVRLEVNNAFEEMLYIQVQLSEEFKGITQLQNLFWFGQPRIIILAFQFTQFMLSVCTAIYVQNAFFEPIEIALYIAGWLVILAAIAVYIGTLPQVINDFSMVTHVGNLVDKQLLGSSLRKQQMAFQKLTMPPTLRQATMLARIKSKKDMNLKQKISLFISSWQFCRIINYCILLDFTVVSLRMATETANGIREWKWTWYNCIEIIFACVFFVEGLLILYVLGWRRIVRFEQIGVSLDLLIIAIASLSCFATVIWRSIDSESNEGFEALSHLDFLIVLRLARWTRRVFYMGTTEKAYGEEISQHLITVQELLAEHSDLNAIGGLMNTGLEEKPGIVSSHDQNGEQAPEIEIPHYANLSALFASTKPDEEEEEEIDKVYGGLRKAFPLSEEDPSQPSSYALSERERKTMVPSVGTSLLPPSDQDSRTKSLFMKKPPSADLVMENASTHKIGDPERPEAKSAKELWVRTCQLNPDVVALHGGLSVNILRLMLDLKDNATSSTRRQSTLFREPSIRTKRPLLYTDPSVHSSGHTRNTRGYAQSTRGIDSSLHSASSNRGVRSMRLLGSSSHAQKGRDKRSLGTIDVKDEYMRQPMVCRLDIRHIGGSYTEEQEDDDLSENNRPQMVKSASIHGGGLGGDGRSSFR